MQEKLKEISSKVNLKRYMYIFMSLELLFHNSPGQIIILLVVLTVFIWDNHLWLYNDLLTHVSSCMYILMRHTCVYCIVTHMCIYAYVYTHIGLMQIMHIFLFAYVWAALYILELPEVLRRWSSACVKGFDISAFTH